MSARTCRRWGVGERSISCSHATKAAAPALRGWACGPRQRLPQVEQLLSELLEARIASRRLQMDHNVHTRQARSFAPSTVDLSDPPLESVADYRRTHLPRRCDPQSGELQGVRRVVQGDEPSVATPTIAITTLIVGPASEPFLLRQSFGHDARCVRASRLTRR